MVVVVVMVEVVVVLMVDSDEQMSVTGHFREALVNRYRLAWPWGKLYSLVVVVQAVQGPTIKNRPTTELTWSY